MSCIKIVHPHLAETTPLYRTGCAHPAWAVAELPVASSDTILPSRVPRPGNKGGQG
jgi:hypothetical protein